MDIFSARADILIKLNMLYYKLIQLKNFNLFIKEDV